MMVSKTIGKTFMKFNKIILKQRGWNKAIIIKAQKKSNSLVDCRKPFINANPKNHLSTAAKAGYT